MNCTLQAAKVVTANAASVGDLLVGVPLLCSSGLRGEAAAVLQEAGLWRYAATLAAQLPPAAAAAALDNWAHHMQQVAPSPPHSASRDPLCRYGVLVRPQPVHCSML